MKFERRLNFASVPEWVYIDYRSLKHRIRSMAAGLRSTFPEDGVEVPNFHTLPEVPGFEHDTDGAHNRLKAVSSAPLEASVSVDVIEAEYHRATSQLLDEVVQMGLEPATISKVVSVAQDPSSAVHRVQAEAIETFVSLLKTEVEKVRAFSLSLMQKVDNRYEECVELHSKYLSALQRQHELSVDRSDAAYAQAELAALRYGAKFKAAVLHAGTRIMDTVDYLALNQSGFRSICRKFERRLFCSGLNERFSDFSDVDALAKELREAQTHLDDLYATVFPAGEVAKSVASIRAWKDNPLRCDYEAQARRAVISLPVSSYIKLSDLYVGAKRVKRKVHKVWPSVVLVLCLLAMALCALHSSPAVRCGGVLGGAAVLWATEAVPLFVTALLIPVATVLAQTFTDGDDVMPAIDAAKLVIHTSMSPVIFLVLAGFSIATALSKYQIDTKLTVKVLGLAGGSPRRFLLFMMIMGALISTFVSSVASPVIILAAILPIIRSLPRSSKFSISLLLGNAIACNLGGMMSPISSPQNAIAVDVLSSYNISISFARFLLVSTPIVLFLVLISYVILLVLFPSDIETVPPLDEVEDTSSTGRKVAVVVISILSILSWCFTDWLEENLRFGDQAMVSLIPVFLFYATGLLTKKDFEHSLPWAMIALVMGGNVLGKAVESSKLLNEVEAYLEPLADLSTWTFTMILTAVMAVVASVISHTVSALILFPIIARISGDVVTTLMVTTFMNSGAAGLPVSSFPNISTSSVVDKDGKPYIPVSLLGKIGWLSTFINFAGFVTVGYGLVTLLL